MKTNRKRRGIVTVWVAVFGLAILLMLGIACDTAYVYLVGHQLQNTADASALAGTLQVRRGTTISQKAAADAAAACKAGGVFIKLMLNPGNTAGGDVVVGSYNSGSFVPGGTPANAVQVRAKRTASSQNGALPLVFGPGFGFNVSDVERTATAQISGNIMESAIVLLNPNGSCVLQLIGTGGNPYKVDTKPDSSHVGVIQINSTSSNSVCWNGNAQIRAGDIYLGGNQTSAVGSNVLVGGKFRINAPPVPDPLAWLPPPSKPPLQTNNKSPLNPGWYSGGLPTGKNMKLNAGIYYIDGGITMGGNDFLDASAGVMLYLHTGSINMGGNSDIKIQPMASGAYQGISIYQDRANTASSTLKGTTSLNNTGTIYMPGSALSVDGTPKSVGRQIIADKLTVQGDAAVVVKYDGSNKAQDHKVWLVK